MKVTFRVFPFPPKFPNYLRYPVQGGSDRSLNVGELSPEDASALWDEWKALWLAHVEKRAASTVSPVEKP